MKQRLPLLLGVFVVMALSNSIIPILTDFAEGAAFQSAIFSAYFLGAFVTVLPAGIISDRIGKVPLIRTGLALTLVSGLLMVGSMHPAVSFGARLLEGIGAGLFVPSAMSWLNLQKDHTKMSGNFMAALNLGLVFGLLGTGWFAAQTGVSLGGAGLFTVLAAVSLALTIYVREPECADVIRTGIITVVRRYLWLFISCVVLVGVTGVVTTLYPEFTGGEPQVLALQIAGMNIATIVAVMLASRSHLEPIRTIRVSALVIAVSIALSYITPLGLILTGAAVGFVIIAQMTFLAETKVQQGVMMGLFNASSYAGMTLLPPAAGVIAEVIDFRAAFLLTAIISALMFISTAWCDSHHYGL